MARPLPPVPDTPEGRRALIRAEALAAGFDAVAFAPATVTEEDRANLAAYVAEGRHGTMTWMEDTLERRSSPTALWPEALTAITLGLNYRTLADPLDLLDHTDRGYISVYARHRDYHDLVKKRLKQVAGWLHRTFGADVKVFVDTAPVLEKSLAIGGGLGWRGKHTNLVSRSFGSWLFLGEILTTLPLSPAPAEEDAPVDAAQDRTFQERDHCGSCTRCLDICPTGAFDGPRRIDARKCISYLTIEHKEAIPRALRPLMGNRIYGCDDCTAVCPWNRFAPPTPHSDFLPRIELTAPRLADLATLDDTDFRTLFTASPVKRIGRDRFIRNVLIAIGNSGTPALAQPTEALLTDPAPLVRGAAVWALSRLLTPADFAILKARYSQDETDPEVHEEWTACTP